MDQAGAGDRDILDVLAPDQAVAPMAVAEILIELFAIVFGQVVAGAGRRLDHGALGQHDRDAAAQADRIAAIAAGGDGDGAALRPGGGGRDGGVDRGRIERRAVALRAMVADVDHRSGMGGEGEEEGPHPEGGGAAGDRHVVPCPVRLPGGGRGPVGMMRAMIHERLPGWAPTFAGDAVEARCGMAYCRFT